MGRAKAWIGFGLCLLFVASGDGYASPDKYTWRQQTLIGANETHFFYYETIRNNPGSYYEYSDEISLCRKRRADYVVDETIVLRKIRYMADSWTLVWSIATEDSTLSFDLAKYLQKNHVCPAIHGMRGNLPYFDAEGIYVMEDSNRVTIVSMISISSQAPLMRINEKPQVVGSWITAEPWRKTRIGQKQTQTVYYLVKSGWHSDEGLAEDIIVGER